MDIKALEPLGFVQTCFLMASMSASPSINTGSLMCWCHDLPYTSCHRYMREGSVDLLGRHRHENVSSAGPLRDKPVGFLMTPRAEWVPALHSTLIPREVG